MNVTGIHYVTAITISAEKNYDFYVYISNAFGKKASKPR